MEDRIEKQIQIGAPVSRVWRALTDSEQFGEWFGVKVEGPFVAGGKVGIQLKYPGKEHVRMEVAVKEIKPETYFSYAWHPYAVDMSVDYSKETPTLVEFHLEPTAAGALLKVTESGFEKIPSDRRALAFRSNSGGWAHQVKNIEAYVTHAS